MERVFIFLVLCIAFASGQTLSQRARVKDHDKFFTQVIQETIYEIERRGFSTLKLTNITQNVNTTMYRFHALGTVRYYNGFLVSVQHISVTNMRQTVGTNTVDGVRVPTASVQGTLNLIDSKLGYDVLYTPVEGEPQHFTGDFNHSTIRWIINIFKNLNTREVSISLTSEVSGGLVYMSFRPDTNISQVLSRQFFPYNNSDGVRSWEEIILPIMLDVIANKIPFPEVCYSHC
ncbi:hypothetical protein HW555_012675 [Spodoptera exigua]|uniref:Uncharacterized protein n=1 Tax=Spodoptera exigua TaxID=7107 RepID=A0A835G6L1_SPOEX|nr:hypothetical protein HW555_012675 [Spodoptera exigua]KAH9643005.1 hypothetical protein HF086_013566 [Spodoptera exigua]